ncbi:facilitated trehalose transporter Tret1-2 homolog [Orussus abietinus]|uniref:facilitated trehalose transporter Tret1-2 homolog n=1 Tax=Orussus abietinus TaxID=222816 RepID=UPI000C715D6F|nr:facilitated trehalose transporter Tret1-2 homolog [Orussus abietinus]
MYAYVIGFVLEESESLWRLSLICAVACAPIALVNLIPESPLYHVIRDDKNAARRSLEWYRGEEYKLEDELEELHILAKAMKSPLTSLDFLKRRKLRRALLVSTLATAVQQLCGVTPFVTLSLLFFDNMDSGDMTSGDQTLVVGAVQILSSVLAIFLVDRLGRKILLTVSSAAVALCLCLLGFYYKWRDEDPQICDDYPWASPLLVVLFFFFFNLGLGPIPSAMLGDSFPVQVRQSCANRVAFFGHGITILMMILCGVVVIQLGLSHLLWTYCVFTWAGAALFCVFVEETRGRSLLDLQREQVFEVPETSEENETAEI